MLEQQLFFGQLLLEFNLLLVFDQLEDFRMFGCHMVFKMTSLFVIQFIMTDFAL